VYALLRSTDVPGSVPNGGYRTTAAASDHHVARSTFLNVNEPSAEKVLRWMIRCEMLLFAQIG